MAHFDPTALCFLNRGMKYTRYEGNKVIDTETNILHVCPYYKGFESKSELLILFVLKLMRIRIFRAARLLK